MRSPRRLLFVVAAGVGLLAAGCSGDDSSARSTTTAVVTAPATTAPVTSAPATTAPGSAGSAGTTAPGASDALEADLIRQFLANFGGVQPTDAEIACVTGKLPAGTLDTIIAEVGKPGGSLGTAIAPALRAVVACKPASLVDAVRQQLTRVDPNLSLTTDQSGCVVGGFLDVVAANPSLVGVVLGGTRIGGLPADVRTQLTAQLTPRVQACVPADTATRVLAAVDRL